VNFVKVLTIFGTRPEAIKMAPVIRELQRRSDGSDLESLVCVTAQHRQMLDQVLHLFGIGPDYDLDLMEIIRTPTRVASAVLAPLEHILKKERPDWVLVQGDTTTVAAASLAAFYAGAKVGHVEAGLRTHNKWQPFPEEINRRVAGVIADLHFAPTKRARDNLLREGVPEKQIIVTGNPVIDALNWVAEQPPTSEVSESLMGLGIGEEMAVGIHNRGVEEYPSSHLILVTAHRRENFGRPLENICLALRDIALQYDHRVQIVYSVHLNPNVQETVHRILGNVPNVILAPPLDYQLLVQMMKRSYLILTDSGGIQEEAPALGVPVLVLREVTERPEAVEAGTVRVIGSDRERIVSETARLLDEVQAYEEMARAVNPYGDGNATERIVGALLGEPLKPWSLPNSGGSI